VVGAPAIGPADGVFAMARLRRARETCVRAIYTPGGAAV